MLPNTLFFGSLYSLTPFGPLFQFMDLTSLQETLPDPHIATDYSGSLTEPWISQNSTMSYIPSGPQGSCSWLILLLMHKYTVTERLKILAVNTVSDF